MSISLSSISRTTRNSLPPRVIVHGAQKVGKSTFAAGAYKPIFLPLEDGLSGIEVDAFPLLTSYDQVMEALAALNTEKHGHGTVVIDSLDWFEPLVWQAVCREHGTDNIEKVMGGFGKGYIAADAYWKRLFAALDALRSERGMASILICHNQVKRFEAPDVEAFDRYELKLNKRALAIAVEWADCIFYATEEVTIKKETSSFNKIRTRGMGTGRRVMHSNAQPSFIAGNRYNLPDVLPLSWDALVQAMAAAAQAA